MKRLAMTILAVPLLAIYTGALHGAEPPQTSKGVIKGRVVRVGEKSQSAKQDHHQKGHTEHDKSGSNGNTALVDSMTAVAYLVNPVGNYSEVEKAFLDKTPEVAIGQKNCQFVPYFTIVHKKQRLTFKMDELKGHTIHVPTNTLGVMLPTDSATLEILVKQRLGTPNIILCDVHAKMEGYVLVTEHPFAVFSKADGTFEIKGVPAGDQHLIVWHPSRGYLHVGGKAGMPVKVIGNQVTDVGDFLLTPKASEEEHSTQIAPDKAQD